MRPKIEWTWLKDREGLVGLDEVNFSPSLAGDCVVAACWLPLDEPPLEGIRDSKDLEEHERLELFAEIGRIGTYSVAPASVSDIGRLGIYEARNIAALTALYGLLLRIPAVKMVITDGGIPAHLFDGTGVKHLRVPSAGRASYLVGAASIVAKCYGDALFTGYDRFWPGYGIGSNHGNNDDEHLQKLRELGPTPVHRTRNYGKQWWQEILKGTPWES